jgi:multidrug resistance efflux pump
MTIRSLRPEARPDNARNQIRAGQSLARRLYLAALVGASAWIGYLFIGTLLVLDADGLVIENREAIAPPYAAQVLTVSVHPGQSVRAGDLLATVVSTQMLDLISDLTTRTAQSEARAEQVEARLSAIAATLPTATRRLRAAEAAAATIDKALSSGFSTSIRVAETNRDRYDAAREVAALQAESRALMAEKSSVLSNGKRLAEALAKAAATYRDGVITAPVNGVVGPRTVDPGVVLSRGEKIADIYHGGKFVLAYLPTNRLYQAEPGQEVVVTDGTNRARGRIARIESFADAVPPEFQNALRGIDRQQVARVAIDGPMHLPLLTKIKVTDPRAPANLIAEGQDVFARAADRIAAAIAGRPYAAAWLKR